jgi:hypothetical protein
MDTLAQFLDQVDVAKVEAERFPGRAAVKRESFGAADHRAMLAVHLAERIKFATRNYRRDFVHSVEGDELEAEARMKAALKESMEYRNRASSRSISATLAQQRAQQEFDEKGNRS